MKKEDKKDMIRLVVLFVLTFSAWVYTMTNANATTYYLIDNCDFLYATQENVDGDVILCLDTLEDRTDRLGKQIRVLIEQLHARGYYDG